MKTGPREDFFHPFLAAPLSKVDASAEQVPPHISVRASSPGSPPLLFATYLSHLHLEKPSDRSTG